MGRALFASRCHGIPRDSPASVLRAAVGAFQAEHGGGKGIDCRQQVGEGSEDHEMFLFLDVGLGFLL